MVLFCPLKGCPRHTDGFDGIENVARHLISHVEDWVEDVVKLEMRFDAYRGDDSGGIN